jgi:hypothetical protein
VRSSLLAAIVSVFAVVATPAPAALVKCANDKGGVVYQDKACPPGKELRDLESDPATLSIVPGTPVPSSHESKKTYPSRNAKQPTTRTVARTARSGNAAERRFITNGMSEAEVVMRIGRPDVQTKGNGKTGHKWSYLPVAGDADTLTTLTLAGGKVVDIERRVAR